MIRSIGFLLCVSVILSASAVADEGMWLLNKLPKQEWKQKYGFTPDDAWVEHVRRSCVRIGAGGSGSFVSPDGLIMTNHHVASDAIGDVSDEKHDYARDGFYARTKDAELICPQMELTVLMKIEDVTAKVNAEVTPEMSPADAQVARKKAKSAIEKEASDKTGLQPEIVTLYQGARYDLYLFKRYTEVRLVFAPEQQIAFFGGDNDNFEYPRFNLDCAFLRAYEDGKPANVEHYLKWSEGGPKENELIFVAGHPGRTQRLYTMDHLRFLRDVQLPMTLSSLNQREVGLIQFMSRGAEPFRTGKEDLLGVQNSRKAFCGIVSGLLDARLMQRKQTAEDKLRAFVDADPKRQAAYGSAWNELASALADFRGFYAEYFLIENRRANLCRQFDIARKLVRAADEKRKPDGERLEEYREANLPTLELGLFSAAPIYDELEQFKLEDGLIRLGRFLGGDHAAVKAALGGKDAHTRAAELISGTKLKDVAFRKKLYEGGTAALADCKDPMILYARELDGQSRKARKQYEDRYEGVERSAYAKIAQASFDMYGESVYPDATFTLRLNDGTVKGYDDVSGRVPAMTKFSGLYELAAKHDGTPPFDLPKRWAEGKSKLDLSKPFNFISTNDIIGGNSGSPMFNAKAEVTGLVFDGNLPGLVWDFIFDMEKGRAVGVHSAAIIEALTKLYDAAPLAREIVGK
ncbi:MAG: S46 family peptidase [Planctomycetota bacterium]